MLPSPFATPWMLPGTRAEIAEATLWHFTRPQFIGQIIQQDAGRPPGNFANAMVHLRPPQGYALDFWKVIRDLTVIDPHFNEAGNWGRYLYFFINEPPEPVRQMNVQDAPISIQVRGADLLAAGNGRVLVRGLDKVLVLRGDYLGPARVSPLPILP